MNLEQSHGYGGGKYDVNSLIPSENLQKLFPTLTADYVTSFTNDPASTGLVYNFKEIIVFDSYILVILQSGSSLIRHFLRRYTLEGIFVHEKEFNININGQERKDAIFIVARNNRISLQVTNKDGYGGNRVVAVRTYDENCNIINTVEITTVTTSQSKVNWSTNGDRFVFVDYDFSSSYILKVQVFDINGLSLYIYNSNYFGDTILRYLNLVKILKDNTVLVGFTTTNLIVFSANLTTNVKKTDWIGNSNITTVFLQETDSALLMTYRIAGTQYFRKTNKDLSLIKTFLNTNGAVQENVYEYYNDLLLFYSTDGYQIYLTQYADGYGIPVFIDYPFLIKKVNLIGEYIYMFGVTTTSIVIYKFKSLGLKIIK